MDPQTERQWDDALKKLRWADENWQKVMFHVVQRFAEEYVEELGKSDYLHLIHVRDGNDHYWGVSLEPEPFKTTLADVSDKLLYYLVQDPDAGAMVAETPFVFDRVPKLPERGDLFLLRDSTTAERAEWSMRNDAILAENNLTAVPTDSEVMVQEDMRYNAIRGEFGIGGERSQTSWRGSLRRAEKKGKDLAKEMEDILVNAKLPPAPEFEERSPEWLENNEHTVLILVGD